MHCCFSQQQAACVYQSIVLKSAAPTVALHPLALCDGPTHRAPPIVLRECKIWRSLCSCTTQTPAHKYSVKVHTAVNSATCAHTAGWQSAEYEDSCWLPLSSSSFANHVVSRSSSICLLRELPTPPEYGSFVHMSIQCSLRMQEVCMMFMQGDSLMQSSIDMYTAQCRQALHAAVQTASKGFTLNSLLDAHSVQ